ncbi:hypothetical protein HNR42_002760 [Deinobacterium chartae]|uniref:Uncharacterized protein n=1 Tax=Deinobacterium chartae TaxID=521158 RepID=A0A841I5X4_9DEIO|nr:hypothetical protein [Deinobacterium chartae]MBB6099322.1 hypothetical protein [Deinobacterium chartae]
MNRLPLRRLHVPEDFTVITVKHDELSAHEREVMEQAADSREAHILQLDDREILVEVVGFNRQPEGHYEWYQLSSKEPV